MAFCLGAKVKSLSCYLQKTVEWQKPRHAAFSDWKQQRCGETEKRGKMKLVKAETIHMWTRATDCLSFCEMRKIEFGWKARTNEVFSVAMKQLPCVNSSWEPLQGNSGIIFFSNLFLFWKTEKQSNWKLTHNLMELQGLSVGRFPKFVWWPGHPANLQLLLGWD